MEKAAQRRSHCFGADAALHSFHGGIDATLMRHALSEFLADWLLSARHRLFIH